VCVWRWNNAIVPHLVCGCFIQSILDNIPAKDAKCTYVYDRYLFHYIKEDGIIYLCMGDEGFGRRIPFAFLQAIMKDFEQYSGGASNAIAYSMNRDFAPVLKRQMEYYAKGGAGGDKLAKIKGEVEQVKGIMVENIERVLERGEQIDLLVDKSENLDVNARLFKKSSTKLRSQMWWENQRWLMAIVAVIVAVIVIIIIAVVHKKNKNKN
jgi:vesicle-associated membrane protein 7